MKNRMISLLLALVMALVLVPKPMAAHAAPGAAITVSDSTFHNRYVMITGSGIAAVYQIGSNGVVKNMNGSDALFVPDTYTVYYGMSNGWSSSFAGGTVTVGQDDTNVTVGLSTVSVTGDTAYDTRYLYATSLFYNTAVFDHVDIRVDGAYMIQVGNQAFSATISNPSVVIKVGGTQVASQSWSGTTDYEWRKTGLQLTKGNIITVELTLDLCYTDGNGQLQTMKNVRITYDSVNHVDKFIDAIAICDMVVGLDFRVSMEDIAQEIRYYAVSYQWKVYHTDGSFTTLPAGAPGEPPASLGHVANERYVYDTEYVVGTSFYDYDKGLLYTFHGWDTYSHSPVFNPIPSTGYHALDDGDTDPANNPAIPITADTYIYGYWTATELAPATAHIAIEKVFLVDGVEMPMGDAQDLWFRIDTGIDRDGDGDTTIDVDYPMIAAATNGEYKIPVYQYDTPFVFTEHNADVPGYIRTTTIAVAGDYIAGFTQSGNSVSVTMDAVYQGENVHLGTVTYTNAYTKHVGEPILEYPTLTLVKSAADTHQAQGGVVFTVYCDEACREAVSTVTTDSGGIAVIGFDGLTPGTYYLKETTPLSGYKADPSVYALTLTAAEPVEELRSNQFVQVTRHSLSVAVPEGSTAACHGDRLHIFNEPILGSMRLNKTIKGLADEDLDKLRCVVILHGPITRDAGGSITDLGETWNLVLGKENRWTAAFDPMPMGEYMLHESFASVHGYIWTGVTYENLETVVYNGITSGIFRVEDETPVTLSITNTYEPWTDADFYIRKIDNTGKALPGAVFRLSADPEGTDVIATATTGADGYTYFNGLTVPDGQTTATYYLREVRAPEGYYRSDTVYQVVITAVTVDGITTHEPTITPMGGSSDGFDINTDLLTVTNSPVLGQLTVTKAFENGFIPDSLTGVAVQVTGPGGYLRLLELNPGNNWSVTLENLPLGTYTISEPNANVPGYTWDVAYSSAAVTLAEPEPGMSVPGIHISADATVTNTYTPNVEYFATPTSLTVHKVGENGESLPGAVFTLDRLDADGKTVLSSVSFTTGAEGIVVFDLLTGFVDEDGSFTDGRYILRETHSPAGYRRTDATWVIRVIEDDGQVRVELNEQKNAFEHFWDWVIGDVDSGTWEDGVLTVRNRRDTAAPNPTESTDAYKDNAKTGDFTPVSPLLITAIVSAAALCSLLPRRKKRF